MSADRRQLPYDPAEVRRSLQQRIDTLLPALGIKDRPAGGIVTPLNPRRGDRHAGSFVIWTGGEGIGAWKDYAIGRQGDVFDLIEYLQGLQAWIDAYWWALDFLGLQRGAIRSAGQAELDRRRAEEDRKAAEAKAKHDADAAAGKAFAFWLKAEKEIRGTPVWTYLTQARGLPLERLRKAPGAIRHAPAIDHIDRDTGEVTSWPAMLSAMSFWDGGQVRGLHRTYLARDGLGKAPVAASKKMIGSVRGCAIRVWKGASGLNPEAAARAGQAGPLVITEGIEDALTAAIGQPQYRVWAAGSLSLMGVLGWPACASAVVLVADNDWQTPQAIEAFARVEATWRGLARGRPLKVVRAQAGKDLNDWARGVQT